MDHHLQAIIDAQYEAQDWNDNDELTAYSDDLAAFND